VNNKHAYIDYAAKKLVPANLDHVLEFGVYKGTSLRIIKKALKRHSTKHDVFGFDSFEGLQEDWITIDGDVLVKQGHFSTRGRVPDILGVKWFVGWFEDTIPEYLKIAKPIALLHVDCDLYKPAREIFYGLQNFIVQGTVIAMDDWFYERDPRYNDTVQKAFYEWAEEYERAFSVHKFPGYEDSTCGQRVVEVLR